MNPPHFIWPDRSRTDRLFGVPDAHEPEECSPLSLPTYVTADREIPDSSGLDDDAYARMVEYLTAHPNEIYKAWQNIYAHWCGPLFYYCGTGLACGCLTQIRLHPFRVAQTDELTLAIRADDRIPKHGNDIRPEHLPTFSAWQRRIDRELGRTPPTWTPPAPSDEEVGARLDVTERPDRFETL